MADSQIITGKRPLIESSCLFTNKENSNPFSDFNIIDSDFLDGISERSACPRCYKSRRYYCYNCYVPVDEICNKIPYIKLPVKIDIIKHPKEVEGKSTSAHAAVLAPEDVRIFTYPDFPNYKNEKVLLIFPGKSAVALQDWWASHMPLNDTSQSVHNMIPDAVSKDKNCRSIYSLKNPNLCHCFSNECDKVAINENKSECPHCVQREQPVPFDRVVFIDSTWKQTKRIYGDTAIRSLPCVVLTSHKSLFWRHQRGKPEGHLATIEAIYYFLVDLHHLMHPGLPYCGRYDNLLLFFKFMYYKIRTLYDPKTLRAYQNEMT